MEAFLSDANSVLLLGCGGGNLATMLARQGKSVTVVDHTRGSFDLGKRFFGLPKEIPRIAADFREYLLTDTRTLNGITIDIGKPGFRCGKQYSPDTNHLDMAPLEPR